MRQWSLNAFGLSSRNPAGGKEGGRKGLHRTAPHYQHQQQQHNVIGDTNNASLPHIGTRGDSAESIGAHPAMLKRD